MQALQSAGKVTNVAKRDEAWKHCQALVNMEPMIRARNRVEVPIGFPSS